MENKRSGLKIFFDIAASVFLIAFLGSSWSFYFERLVADPPYKECFHCLIAFVIFGLPGTFGFLWLVSQYGPGMPQKVTVTALLLIIAFVGLLGLPFILTDKMR